jgi:hypothetical protein
MADIPRLAGTPVMPEYRAYMVGPEGNFVGYEPMICADDREAIGKAKRLAGQYPVELWSGPMLVSSLPRQPARAVTYEIHQGVLVPKAT